MRYKNRKVWAYCKFPPYEQYVPKEIANMAPAEIGIDLLTKVPVHYTNVMCILSFYYDYSVWRNVAGKSPRLIFKYS